MNTPYEIDSAQRPIVYIRSVKTADLPEDLRHEAQGHDELFAVHSSEGERLALVADRALAFVLARQNNMDPVTVH